MRAYAALACLAVASMASCHLFLDSRGLQPGSGGGGTGGTGGQGGTATGVGGDGLTGGGGAGEGGLGGSQPTCHVPLDEECNEIDFNGFEQTEPGIFDAACTGPFGTSDNFSDISTSSTNWMAQIQGPDSHLQICQSEGELVVTPNSVDDYWFRDAVRDEIGPFVFQRVCSSFAMLTRVTRYAPTVVPPQWVYRGVGIVLAHPSDSGLRHLHMSFGHHAPDPNNDGIGFYGTQLYPTPANTFTETSGSPLLAGAGDPEVLGVCRDETGAIRFFSALDGADMDTYTRIDPPFSDFAGFEQDCCMHVGLTASSYAPEGPESCSEPVRGQFDWVGFWDPNNTRQTSPTDEATCKQLLTEIYGATKDE